MPWVQFEPTITASERAKTVHALDRSTTVTNDYRILYFHNTGPEQYYYNILFQLKLLTMLRQVVH
jgi:hypothetical protein